MTIHTHQQFSSASRIQARSPQTQPGPSPLDSAQPVSFYPAGSEIYAQGERAKNLYQVEFGSVRVYRLLADGLRDLGGPDGHTVEVGEEPTTAPAPKRPAPSRPPRPTSSARAWTPTAAT